MTVDNLRINIDRLMQRINELAQLGSIEDGGVCRLALTDEDKLARDLVVSWMRELELEVSVDQIGNVVGLRPGITNVEPVMTGSHLDTVRTGGRYDGALGVLAGLEVAECLNDAGIRTQRPLAFAFFTNEEGSRFAPDMMGSMVHQGHLPLEDMLPVTGIDGTTVESDLKRIGYMGDVPCGSMRANCFVELHVEQGPVLESKGVTIGAVEGVQGISWTELTCKGVANHAGTTPMPLRHDAGFVAMNVALYARELADDLGGSQVATVGSVSLKPNLVNVIPHEALITVDLRNTEEQELKKAESRLLEYAKTAAAKEGVEIKHRPLARFSPVAFDPEMIGIVEDIAKSFGHSVLRLPSGAGHDAQSFAPNCPTAMIFVPSVGGISHNVKEFTEPRDIESGANVLLHVLVRLAS